jgi:hypothetical protein
VKWIDYAQSVSSDFKKISESKPVVPCGLKAYYGIGLTFQQHQGLHPTRKVFKAFSGIAELGQPGNFDSPVIKGSCIMCIFTHINSNHQSFRFDLH